MLSDVKVAQLATINHKMSKRPLVKYNDMSSVCVNIWFLTNLNA